MKRAVAVFVLVLAGLSCLIDRHSEDFECKTDADCAMFTDPDRECSDGYCVKLDCPNACESCDSGKVCNKNCNNPTECSSGVDCPNGYNCHYTCSRNCGPIDCTDAASCTVSCSGTSTQCGPLNCGSTTAPCACTPSSGTCL